MSRRELQRSEHFEQISPEVGELDEQALNEALHDDPDEVLSLLAELTGATDPSLRARAREVAGRLFLDVARTGPSRPRGVGRMVEQAYRIDGGDLDLDASTEEIVAAMAEDRAVDPDRLRMRAWTTPSTSLCLLVDRSGSMSGRPLATAALAAAAASLRAPDDYSVISFARRPVVVKSQDLARPVVEVVDAVLALRGSGTTDLAAALLAAADQQARSRARRRIVILLSDCRSTEPGDAIAAAEMLDELVIIAPEGDDDDARDVARATGAVITTVAGPSDIADAFSRALLDTR